MSSADNLMLSAKNLSFSYSNRLVLDSLNFSVKKGSFVSFIGPSGCGKTTLLNILLGILKPDNGEINYKTFSYSVVLQKNTLLPWLNLIDNIILPSVVGKNSKSDIVRNAEKIIELVGLKGYEKYYPSQLSGGMCKRAEIARALIEDKDLLILDEPFSSLDILTREKLNILLKEISFKTDKTVMLVTHSIEEAAYLSDEVYIMSMQPSKIVHHEVIDKKDHNDSNYILSHSEEQSENNIRVITANKWNDSVNIEADYNKPETVITGKGFSKSILIQFFIIAFVITGLKYFLNISDFYVPYPHAVFLRFFKTIQTGMIFPHVFTTVVESLSGFTAAFIITCFLGYLISLNERFYQWLMPALIACNTIPSIAIAPILITWFGFGLTPKILISIIIIFFPMLINTVTAFKNTRKRYGDLIQIYKPGFLFRLIKIEIPGAIPFILTGVKVSSTLSVIGAVVGEFMAGSKGLGALINNSRGGIDYEMMYVPIIWLILLGLLYYTVSSFLYDIVSKNNY